MEQLLSDIKAFCAVRNMPVTRFGLLALNDPALVIKLNRGRRMWPETEAKIRTFMVTYQPESAAA